MSNAVQYKPGLLVCNEAPVGILSTHGAQKRIAQSAQAPYTRLMTTTLRAAGFLALALLVGAASYYYPSFSNVAAVSAAQEPTVVRWLIGHQPTYLFEKSNTVFADEVARRSGGTLRLEVLTPEDFGITGRDLTREEIARFMSENKADVSSVYVGALAEAQSTAVFSVPFLFRDYPHVDRFIESDMGRSVLVDISESTPFSALAFTFSGGFISIASQDPKVKSVSDLKERRIAYNAFGTELTGANIAALGAVPAQVSAEVETPTEVLVTYTRLGEREATSIKSIIDVFHEVYATTMIASDSFMGRLTQEERNALTEAAVTAAAVERQDSIQFAAETRQKLLDTGVQVTSLSGSEKATLVKQLQAAYGAAREKIGLDLIDAVAAM